MLFVLITVSRATLAENKSVFSSLLVVVLATTSTVVLTFESIWLPRTNKNNDLHAYSCVHNYLPVVFFHNQQNVGSSFIYVGAKFKN